jgi:uncharacterized membrane protein
MDSHARTIAKTLTWRALSLIITGSIAWIITRQVSLAVTIGISDFLIKLGSYYVHERAWNRVNFGRAKPPDYEI